MKKLARILGVFVLILGISLAFGAKSDAADKADVDKIMNYINTAENIYERNSDNDIAIFYENTGMHDHFPTTWKNHYYFVVKRDLAGQPTIPFLHITMREYQSFYTAHDARGFIAIGLSDYNSDGIVDNWYKEFYILLDENTILIPRYPKGYLNKEWPKMTREEAQALYDAEIKYALKRIEEER